MAALNAIEFCKTRGLDSIILKGDSLKVVNIYYQQTVFKLVQVLTNCG